MGNGIIGKILYFWIFMLGGVFVAWVLGFTSDNKTCGIFLGAIAVAYIVFQAGRSLGKKKREEKMEANRQPVRKGTNKKRR